MSEIDCQSSFIGYSTHKNAILGTSKFEIFTFCAAKHRYLVNKTIFWHPTKSIMEQIWYLTCKYSVYLDQFEYYITKIQFYIECLIMGLNTLLK